jgi:hypothetical protein
MNSNHMDRSPPSKPLIYIYTNNEFAIGFREPADLIIIFDCSVMSLLIKSLTGKPNIA